MRALDRKYPVEGASSSDDTSSGEEGDDAATAAAGADRSVAPVADS